MRVIFNVKMISNMLQLLNINKIQKLFQNKIFYWFYILVICIHEIKNKQVQCKVP